MSILHKHPQSSPPTSLMIKKLDLREFRAGDTLDSEHSSAPTKIWLTSDLRNFEAFGLGATGLERHNPGLFNVLMSSKSGATTGSLSDKFTNHRLWATTAAKLGRPFRKLPFRGAMYLVNSGENHSALTDNIGWRRELLRRFTPARRANDELRAEFALNIDDGLRRHLGG